MSEEMEEPAATAERAAVEALLDEWDRARETVVARARSFDTGFLSTRLPSGHEPTVLHVLRHLVGGAYAMTRHVVYGMGRDPAPKTGLRAAEITAVPDFVRAIGEAREYMVRSMAALKDRDLERTVRARWGPTYTLEAMLEHSIVHLLRHRRQLERLWLTTRGALPEEPAVSANPSSSPLF